MDSPRRSARLIPVVLPLLHGPPYVGRGRTPDQAVEGDPANVAQIKRHCEPGDPTCRPRQRQALLHWAYDSRKI